jgi:hypothetical protein
MSADWRDNFYKAQERDRQEAEAKREASISKQRISRAEGKERRRLRSLERGALGRARTSSERRRIKEEIAELQAALKARAKEERGKAEEGAIYDVKTHEEPTDNRAGLGNKIENNDIDEIQGQEAAGDSTGSLPGGDDGIGVEFNGSVIICINGSPKYIDIPYDSETGAYSISSGANFPIS